MHKDEIYERIRSFFPLEGNKNLVHLLEQSLTRVDEMKGKEDAARIPSSGKQSDFQELVRKYSVLSSFGRPSEEVLDRIVGDLFGGVPRWNSPNLQYNVGTGVNSVALAVYALAMSENIYAINDGLAGNSLVAEDAVSNLLGQLAGTGTQPRGVFTFGGTSTNLYAKKIGLKKAAPQSSRQGIPHGARVVFTRDCHFSHEVSADWLGIGNDNAIIIEPGCDRRSDLLDAEEKMRQALSRGDLITSIALNGGTTYNHIVDDIGAFVELRDRLVQDYSLKYTPHLHVDSVIGWCWLVFRDYDFEANTLGVNGDALELIRKQFLRVSQIGMADSWSVDFHKGVGACPVDCSVFMLNDGRDIRYISKKGDIPTHHVAPEFSFSQPVDYTLETTRPIGPALAALATFQTLGLDGYRRNLANLVENTIVMRDLLRPERDFQICFEDASIGFVTMLRLYPPDMVCDGRRDTELYSNSLDTVVFSKDVNAYMKSFFSWDRDKRMRLGVGVEYSFSSDFITLSNGAGIAGVKLYPVSPHFNSEYATVAVKTILEQKRLFDQTVWKK
ncbi:MAG: pyridoxal-dependent decarboxylase [Nanoarchaeota archaeon]